LTERERGLEQTKECYLTEVILFFKTLKEHFEGIQKALTKEMKEIFKELEAEVDQNVMHRKHDEIERKIFLIANDNLIADCLSKDVFYIATDSVLTVSRSSDMHEALNAAQKRIAEFESENSNLPKNIQNDDCDVIVNYFSKLEVEHLNLQLKYQHLKESFENKKSVTSLDAPTFDSVFVIGQLKDQVHSRRNTIRELREKISRLTKKHSETAHVHDRKALDFHTKDLHAKINALHDLNERWRAENVKVKRHYKELYDSIKITRAKHIETTNSLLTEVANLKAQITENYKSNCVTVPIVKSKVLAPGRYVIDIEPIPPRIRNNREVHLDYLKHLKESVGTFREIVEEAKVERPLDRSLASACLYTKHSQEILEYVIGTCPKDFNQREKKHVVTPVTRKKQIIQIVLWYLDSGCLKCMTRDRSRLRNFMKRLIGAVRFENNHFGAIMGYEDYVIGDSVISRVYYVEGLGHNLFSVKQFCDSDLEVAFGKHSCYVRDTNGVKLIKGSRGSNLYTISIEDMMKSSLNCLLSKAFKNKS
nr:integrase, catalytic region, zinc finger, CCHC-type, peptidase aspartic, catalytic [Tanacetum cinerariifolium]